MHELLARGRAGWLGVVGPVALALVAVAVGCSGDSPQSPADGGGGDASGGGGDASAGGGGSGGGGGKAGNSGASDASAPDGNAGDGGWLRVEGNRILTSDGKPFHGRGANVFDTRECGVCAWAKPHVNEVLRRIDVLTDEWHANFMRLDLTSYKSNTENGTPLVQWNDIVGDSAYLADLTTIVRHIEQKPGVYVMITVFYHPSLDANELPTDATAPVYRKLVQTFRDSPRVLFGVTNEPHQTTDEKVWGAMNKAVEVFRSEESADGPHHIVAVQGTQQWARKLDYYVQHPITAGGGANVVYETHAYEPKANFETRFLAPAKTLPVIIGEFGPDTQNIMSMDDCSVLMEQAEQAGIPYLGWAFSPDCPPSMLEKGDVCGEGMALKPTAWGTLLKNRLANPW